MKITDQARDALNIMLKENNADGLLASVHETCCGTSPVFQLAVFDENDTPEEINGIKLVANDDLKEAIDNLEIDVVNGELVILNAVCGCGDGCGGCHE